MCFIRLRKISLSAVAQLLGFSFCCLLRIPSWSRRQRALLRSDTVYRSDQISSCCINMKTIQDQIRDAKFTPPFTPPYGFCPKNILFQWVTKFLFCDNRTKRNRGNSETAKNFFRSLISTKLDRLLEDFPILERFRQNLDFAAREFHLWWRNYIFRGRFVDNFISITLKTQWGSERFQKDFGFNRRISSQTGSSTCGNESMRMSR